MRKADSKTITACCSHDGAALKLKFDPAMILTEMRTRIEKPLLKKGVALQWSDQEEGSELFIRVISMDQGNQFLRWLLPFIAPAVLEVEGQLSLGGAAPAEFQYTQRAHIGLLGGSGKGMLKICAQRVAGKIVRNVLRSVRS